MSGVSVCFTRVGYRVRFVKEKLNHSSSFRSDQIHNNHCEDFGHTLLCYLYSTLMFNKPVSILLTILD
jgi:hypothetical protein